MKDVLDIVTDNLINERLDNIVLKNSNYQEIRNRVDAAVQEVEQIDSNTKDIQKIIEKYDSAIHEETALYARLAYQQGMKDFAQFLASMI